MEERTSPVVFLKRLAIGVLLINVCIVALAGISIHRSRLDYETRATITTQNLSQALDEYINGVISKIDVTLMSVKDEAERQLVTHDINMQTMNETLARQYARIPELDGLRITNAKGEIICGTGLVTLPAVSVADRDYFISLRNNSKSGIFISKPVFGRIVNKWIIIIAHRFNNPDGSFAGLVYGTISLENFVELFSKINIGKSGVIVLFDSERNIICRYPEPQGIGSTIGKQITSAELQGLFKSGYTFGTYRTRSTIDGIERVFSYSKISVYPIYELVALAKDDYLAEWRNENAKMLALVVLFVLATFFLSVLIYRKWKSEKRAVEELVKSRDELEIRVTERTTALKKANEDLRDELTERKKLEAQLLQSQKMESIGLLAGGIAHDLNNVLGAMMGFTALLQMEIKEDHPARNLLDHLPDLTDRAATLVKNLMAFSRKQVLDIKPTSLNDIVRTTGQLLSRLIGEDVKLNLNLNPSDKDIVVNADAGQIAQALMNLATNARDAMPEGGTLTIRTKAIEMDDNFIRVHGYGMSGKYALLLVEDTGIGMDEQTKEKIFEPFYTTKGVWKGTGLGLAMVYGTIKQHNGFIDVYSEPGRGTTFKIYLPAIDEQAEETKAVERIPLRGGTETILLVEDEVSLRLVTKTMLEQYGYKVIEAKDGKDAVIRFNEHKDEIDLIVMDVIMPEKSGKEAYLEMQKVRADVKVIFTSGHTGDILTSKKIAEEGLHFISKPILPKELFERIRDLLDKRTD